MKKVSLLAMLLLVWTTLAVLDVPVAHADGGGDFGSPPQDQMLSGPNGGETSDGDPDDIIEGNRRQGTGNEDDDGYDPREESDMAEIWDTILCHFQLLMWIQR